MTQILIDVLMASRSMFQHYGDLHMAKDPPQVDKARVNYDFVARINTAFLEARQVT